MTFKVKEGLEVNGSLIINSSGLVDGRDVSADGAKLDGIEAGATADQTASEILTAIKTVDGSGSGLDADLLDGQHGSYYYSPANAPDPTLTINGDASGSATFTNLGNATLTLTVADDSHNHVISNVDGLQTALDGKLSTSGKAADSNLLDGLDSTAFLRSDVDDTTSGILTTSQVRWGSGAGTYSGNPRSAVVGYSGGNYGQIGYGWIPTATSGVHTSQINDLQSRIDLNNGIQVYGSGSSVAAGTNVPWTQVLDARTNAFTYKGNTIWHAANDGSGSGLDADLLDGQQGSYYQNASNLTAGTIADARVSGTYSGITLKTDGGNTHYTTPNSGSSSTNDRTVFGLAQFKNDSSAAVGAIVFTAPTTQSTIMHRMRVEGFIHSGGPTVMAVVQGYRTTGAWSQTSKINLGITDIQVRWGVDPTGKNCLILGDVGTTWSYPMMAITHAMFSHSGSSDAYCTGWTVGLVTDLSTYTNVTGTIANRNLNTDISGNAATASQLATARSIALTGDVTGSASFNGSANISISSNVAANVIGAAELNVTGNGTTAQYLRSDGDGSFTWATPTDTNTTYSAGSGISLSGTTFSVAAGSGLTQEASGLAITTNGVTATHLAVTGNGTTSQYLRSDGDGTFTWDTPAAPAPTTAQVLSATADASVGAVGTYAWLVTSSTGSTDLTQGSTIAGSSTRYYGYYSNNLNDSGLWSYGSSNPQPSGTWRVMGYVDRYYNTHGHFLALRIS